MDIRFVSSLTPEDELRVAEGLLLALTSFLDQLPIAYTLRIEASTRVFHHHHTPTSQPAPAAQDVILGLQGT